MGNPFAIGILVWVEAFALPVSETDKALTRAFFADKTCCQRQQVIDLYRQHGAAIRVADFLADEAPGLPVFRDAGARQHRDPGKDGEVAGQ